MFIKFLASSMSNKYFFPIKLFFNKKVTIFKYKNDIVLKCENL